MCPRATAQHGGAAMARGIGAAAAHSFGEEEYIDLDLSSCGEFEFRVCRSSVEELVGGRVHKGVPRSTGGKLLEADAGGGGGGGGGRRSTATVAPLQNSHAPEPSSAQPASAHAEGSRRKKPCGKTVHAKLQASRAFFRSLFARTSCSDERWRGIGVRPAGSTSSSFCQIKNMSGCSGRAPTGQARSSTSSSAPPTTLRKSIEQEKLMDEEEHAAISRQRKSFSGVIKWRPTTTTPPPPAPPTKPQHPPSSTRRRNSCSPSVCAPAPAPQPPLKRSTSARSESEGLIQGAIAYCKRSQQPRVLARKSVSDAAALSSFSSSFPSVFLA